MNIVFVTYEKRPEPSTSDALVARHLKERGHQVRGVAWTDPVEMLMDCDLAVVRSTWDYPRKLTQFQQWLEEAESKLPIANSVKLIQWNADKTYLFDLEKKGLRIPRTAILSKATDVMTKLDEWQANEAVVKPSVGASGQGVQKVNRESTLNLTETPQLLIQEFIPEVQQGELSLAFFSGEFSHAVIKTPVKGEFRINSAYGGQVQKIDLPTSVVNQAREVVSSLNETPLYVRVDGIVIDDVFMVFELELIEPSFYFTCAPESASHFAEAILSYSPER